MYFFKKEPLSIGCDDFKEIKYELFKQVTMSRSSLFLPSAEMYKVFSKTS
jgi:hypothetical protein